MKPINTKSHNPKPLVLMRMNGFRIVITFLAVFYTLSSFSTAQYGDILIEGNDTSEIFSNPLEVYLERKNSRTINGYTLTGKGTACYRGYRATWQIKNDSLFLINIRKGCHTWRDEKPEYFDLASEFGSKIVFANWVSHILYNPQGELLKYIHAGYASIYEREKYYYLNRGKLDSIYLKENIIFQKGRIKPIEKYLSDTLKQAIINHIDSSSIPKFEDKDFCSMYLQFDSEGKIDTITNEYANDGISFFEQKMYDAANSALDVFPSLMKINHERYRHAEIRILFNSYCIKFPEDYEYGCGR